MVRRVFDLYERGQSYQGISDLLNTEGVNYLRERPLWNKHLIKRVLQNPKYIGDDLYPQIIPEEQFQKDYSESETVASRSSSANSRSMWP